MWLIFQGTIFKIDRIRTELAHELFCEVNFIVTYNFLSDGDSIKISLNKKLEEKFH